MELHHDRLINGLLKADLGLLTPEDVRDRLSQDVSIHVESTRASADDLWPSIWFLAAVLEREFIGNIFINAGIRSALPAPVPLSSRCRFADNHVGAIAIRVGEFVNPVTEHEIIGDTRGNQITCGELLHSGEKANPIGCCALAGYLGFAALARAVGVPSFHETWKKPFLVMPFESSLTELPPSFGVLGNGQVGQAFLSLAFFLYHAKYKPTVHLVDKDPFESYNYRTQVLLTEDEKAWLGKPKSEYLSGLCREWKWNSSFEHTEIDWGWRQRRPGQWIAFLGFDNMDARRVGVEGGFEWLFECGVGTDFCRPRVTWHSLPAERELARKIFQEVEKKSWSKSAFALSLGDGPAECGRLFFENIQATAPCLGLVAVAYTWMEIANFLGGNRLPYSGSAYLWSQLLPIDRTRI